MGPIVALYDGSDVGRRVLDLAVSLTERGGDLRVLVWAEDEAVAFETRQLAAHLLETHAIISSISISQVTTRSSCCNG